MKLSTEQKEKLIDFLVDTWEESMDERELINFYRNATRTELESMTSDEVLRSHAE